MSWLKEREDLKSEVSTLKRSREKAEEEVKRAQKNLGDAVSVRYERKINCSRSAGNYLDYIKFSFPRTIRKKTDQIMHSISRIFLPIAESHVLS